MVKKKKQVLAGIIIILIGIFVLWVNLKLFEGSFGKLWPALLLLIGVFLYILYFSSRKKKNRLAVSFLATFISISAIPLFVLTFTSFSHFPYVWPGFILAVGIGLFTVYLYGQRRKTTLFLAQIVTIIPLLVWIFFAMRSKFGLVIGVVLLMIGVALLGRGIIRKTEGAGSEIPTENETDTAE
jgi:hypothetical protein